MKSRFLAFSVLAGLVLLAGCNKILLCPTAAVLADTSTRAVLKQGAVPADPGAAAYTVSITGIDTTCNLDVQDGQADSSVSVSFRAIRAPIAQAAHYSIPYFLAINRGEKVFDKRRYVVQIDFAPGASTATFTAKISSTILKLENGHLPTEYQYLAGLEMSDAERAYIKSMSRYAP